MERAFPLLATLALALLAQTSGSAPRPQAPPPPSPSAPIADDEAARVVERVEAAWNARDLAAYLDQWDFLTPEAREEERDFASRHFGEEQTTLRAETPVATQGRWLSAAAQVFTLTEPRGRAEEWSLLLERGTRGWRVVRRDPEGGIDGLVHLSLDPQGYRADGLSLRLEDFELRMDRGTLFTSPASLGPTVLVFAGEGAVRVSPRPAAEREQLRQFSGSPEMVDRVGLAFVRIHPADLQRVLVPLRLERDPGARSRLAAARRFYGEQVDRAFVLDAALPRSPWWLLPGLGDASVTFETRRRGTLTFTMSTAEFESISLFDRSKRRQICLYPAAGRDTNYNEDDGRAFDLLEHDLTARFEPGRFWIEAQDTLRIQVRVPSSSLRLRLDEDLQVRSIRSAAGEHLFFRVRNQDSVMVSLGALTGMTGEIVLQVRYGGYHRPAAVEREVIQAPDAQPPRFESEEAVVIEDVLVYTNRTAWYPQLASDDYATATMRFDVPQEYTAVSGGTRTEARQANGRSLVAYRQDRPGKYLSVAVGRLVEVGERREGDLSIHTWAVPRLRSEAAQLMANAGDILRFYQQEFGPDPYPSLNLVVFEGFTPGGHSPPGMVLLAERPLLLRRTLRDDPASFGDVPGFFFAHELAHQWWGHGVAGKNYRERWLSEAFAQYAAALWARRTRGEGTFQTVLGRLAKWAVRETDEGPINLGYRLGHVKGNPQIYRALVYDKGAYVLHMLRAIVGEDAFRRALIAFQAAHRFQKAGTEDLRAALEAASGRPLSAYFQEWVYGTTLPALDLAYHTRPEGRGYRTVVEVAAARVPGPLPLQVTLVLPQGREARVVTLDPAGGQWTMETAERPSKVRINEDRALLVRLGRSGS